MTTKREAQSDKKRKAQGDITHFVVPSGSEASLTSFGTASPPCHPEARKRRGTPRIRSG
jgi:hypothetical protein